MSCFQFLKKSLLGNKFLGSIYTSFIWIIRVKMSGVEKEIIQNDFVFSVKKLKSKFYLPYYKKDLIQKAIVMSGNYYEKDLLWRLSFSWKDGMLANHLKDGCILDIGANIGNHTLFFINECGVKKAYCFEPVPETFEILQKNIELNNLQNRVSLFNTAVGKAKGNATISHFSEDNMGGTCLSDDGNGNIQVISIDEIDIPEKVSFVKIDVEGFELNVVLGMIGFIKKHHPVFFIEIRGCFFKQINKIFTSFGYRGEVIEKMPGLDCADYIYY